MTGRLIVTADVHGSYSTWQLLKSLLKETDTLVVAGDLFGTRYGRPSPDFQPEEIKNDIAALGNRFLYVYGNCDVPSFCPGYSYDLEFSHMGLKILLIHGHAPAPALPSNASHGASHASFMVIQGHTHIPKLIRTDTFIHFNPGSLTAPRINAYTYGIIENNRAIIMDLKKNNPLVWLDL